MNDSKLQTVAQIREFLTGASDVTFSIPANESRLRDFIVTVLNRSRYFRLAKGDRGVVFAYMQRLTGYSRQHLSRLVAQYRDTKSLTVLTRSSRTSFARKYGAAEITLLAQTDSWHDTLSGPATKVLLTRAVKQRGPQTTGSGLAK